MRACLSSALLAVLASLFVATGQASEIGQEIADQVDVASYRHFLDDLLYTHAGDNRGPTGPEHDLARDNIAAAFASYGFTVELEPFTYDDYPDRVFHNVVASKVGVTRPDQQFIVGAHYDSIGNPGADDDASGVAGLLEIARVFSSYDVGCTLNLIAFDLEERGLVGSADYVRNHCGKDILGMIALDMIAWDSGVTYFSYYLANDIGSTLGEELDAAADEYGGDLNARKRSETVASDHRSFANFGVPACLLTEWYYYNNPCYHEVCDSVDEPNYISYPYACDIVSTVAGYLADELPAYYPGDCDQDGIVDNEQIHEDPSLDCNENGVLDVCEPGGNRDCNGNSIPDVCDIYFSTSQDLDQNTIPDECQPHHYVPSEYETIQSAVNAAEAGDVVVVADGTNRSVKGIAFCGCSGILHECRLSIHVAFRPRPRKRSGFWSYAPFATG